MPEEKRERPIDSVEITLSDGKPRTLRFNNAVAKRVKRAAGVSSMEELMSRDFIDVAGFLIFEALETPDPELTPGKIDEMIPLYENGELQVRVLAAMAGKSVEEFRQQLEQAKNGQSTDAKATAATVQ